MLHLLLSNSTWKDGELSVQYREPFDILAKPSRPIELSHRPEPAKKDVPRFGSDCRTRTYDPAVNSRLLYQLS